MTKEELKQKAYEYAIKEIPFIECITQNDLEILVQQAYITGAESREKRIDELEEKISVLLSCKNCPENKGGLICQKEYEDKCLAQKIQYIKELQEENKVIAQNLEDTEILNKTYEKRFSKLEKENAELDCQKNRNKFCYSCANATERCFRNEIGCPCEKYKSYKDENAELKKQLEMSNKVYNDNLDYSHHIEDQLTKAKELLERLLITSCNSDVLNLLPNCSEVLRVRVEAEQFLSDVEDKKNV